MINEAEAESYRERTQYENIIKEQILRISTLFSNFAGIDTREKDCYTQFRNIKEAVLTLESLLHPYFDSTYKGNIGKYIILRKRLSKTTALEDTSLYQTQFESCRGTFGELLDLADRKHILLQKSEECYEGNWQELKKKYQEDSLGDNAEDFLTFVVANRLFNKNQNASFWILGESRTGKTMVATYLA